MEIKEVKEKMKFLWILTHQIYNKDKIDYCSLKTVLHKKQRSIQLKIKKIMSLCRNTKQKDINILEKLRHKRVQMDNTRMIKRRKNMKKIMKLNMKIVMNLTKNHMHFALIPQTAKVNVRNAGKRKKDNLRKNK